MVFTKVEGTASSPTPNVIEVTPKAIKEKGRLYVLETEGVEQVNEDLALGRVYWPATGFYNMTLLTRAQPSDEWEIVYKELIRVK